MMQLHNPPNLNLPPLMLQKMDVREEMENIPRVANFIRSNLLLKSEFHDLFKWVADQSKEIEETISRMEKEFDLSAPEVTFRRYFSPSMIGSYDDYRLIRNYLMHSRPGRGMRAQEKERAKKLLLQLRKKAFGQGVGNVKKQSSSIQNRIVQFEQKSKQRLDILTPVTLYLCKRCSRVTSKDRFVAAKCGCGFEIGKIGDTRTEPVAYFEKKLVDFIAGNYWFEHGIDYLLRRKNFQTLCGFHVLGHSGNLHELDNIAESQSTRLRFFGECKTGEIKPNDVFVFAGKMADIGCTKGYMFTLSQDVPKEIRFLARSRNITIIADVFGKDDRAIMNEIRDE